MHSLDRSGQVTGTREDLARLGRCTVPQCDAALRDLETNNAAEVQRRNGLVTVVNRRMKREYISRKSNRFRVERHRRKTGVTPHNQNQIPEPEPEEELERQSSQCQLGKKRAELTKLTIDRASLGRIAREIISNKTGWAYDNCKVQPALFPWPKSLVTVLAKFAGKVSEAEAHEAWTEAVRRTHAAAVDQLARDPAKYVIQCWKEALESYGSDKQTAS